MSADIMRTAFGIGTWTLILALTLCMHLYSSISVGLSTEDPTRTDVFEVTIYVFSSQTLEPVANATLIIYNDSGGEVWSGGCGSNGTAIVELMPGSYTLRASAEGYEDNVTTITIQDKSNTTSEAMEIHVYLYGYKGEGGLGGGTGYDNDNESAPYGVHNAEEDNSQDGAGGGGRGDTTTTGGGEGGRSKGGLEIIDPSILIPMAVVIVVVLIIALSYLSYSRIHGREVLNHVTRKEVLNYIHAHPGVHFRGLMDALGIKQGTLSHHLSKLEGEEYIKSVKDGMYKRYYPADMKVDTTVHLNIPQQKILLCIKEYPGITLDDISHRCGLKKRVVYYNTRVLGDIGLVYLEKEEGVIRCYPEAQAM